MPRKKKKENIVFQKKIALDKKQVSGVVPLSHPQCRGYLYCSCDTPQHTATLCSTQQQTVTVTHGHSRNVVPLSQHAVPRLCNTTAGHPILRHEIWDWIMIFWCTFPRIKYTTLKTEFPILKNWEVQGLIQSGKFNARQIIWKGHMLTRKWGRNIHLSTIRDIHIFVLPVGKGRLRVLRIVFIEIWLWVSQGCEGCLVSFAHTVASRDIETAR